MTQVANGDGAIATERLRVPILEDEAAIAVARELGVIFAQGASERDRSRSLPIAMVQELARTGLLAVTVPAEYGGADASPATVAEIFRLLAWADPSLAQIPHSHFVNVHLLRVAGSPEQRRFFFGEILAGSLFGTAQADARPTGPGAVPARLRRDGPGSFQLTALKGHATGAIFADWLPTLARLDDGTAEGGKELIAFVRSGAEGVTITDGGDPLGQRAAASGQVEYLDVAVASEHIVRRGKAFVGTHAVGSFARLLHAAIEVGIAGDSLADTAEFVRTKAVPEHEAHVQRAQDDILLVQRIGELTVDVRAAEAALEVASRAVTESVRNASDAAATEAAVAVATAKVLAERAALAVASVAFEMGGAASAQRDLNLDRHWRNARTHTLDDPIRWKYHHLGRFTLLGLSPPRHRQI